MMVYTFNFSEDDFKDHEWELMNTSGFLLPLYNVFDKNILIDLLGQMDTNIPSIGECYELMILVNKKHFISNDIPGWILPEYQIQLIPFRKSRGCFKYGGIEIMIVEVTNMPEGIACMFYKHDDQKSKRTLKPIVCVRFNIEIKK